MRPLFPWCTRCSRVGAAADSTGADNTGARVEIESPSGEIARGYSADGRTVSPSMRKCGASSIILITGGTSVKARAGFAGTSLAFPAESAYVEMLHEALADEGIRVSQLVIPGGIPYLRLENGIDDVAERMWQIYSAARDFRTMLIFLEDGRERVPVAAEPALEPAA